MNIDNHDTYHHSKENYGSQKWLCSHYHSVESHHGNAVPAVEHDVQPTRLRESIMAMHYKVNSGR